METLAERAGFEPAEVKGYFAFSLGDRSAAVGWNRPIGARIGAQSGGGAHAFPGRRFTTLVARGAVVTDRPTRSEPRIAAVTRRT